MTKKRSPIHETREAWLNAAIEALRPLFTQLAAVDLPAEVRVSCGFPGGGSARKRIGECWPTKASDGVAQVFVSPVLDDPIQVLGTLVHELIHAWDDCKNGHKRPFSRVARAMGLEGKMTATTVGDELRAVLAEIAGELGPYPHAALDLGLRVKKQSTRMLKVECPACGYTLRTTAKWLEVGVPTCCCGEQTAAVA